jgi:long-chain fatty acid transport protein
MRRFTQILKTATLAIAAVGFVGSSAMATDGMLPNGVGTRNSALAGAGVADQNDASAVAVNPAGLVNSDTQLNVSASVFSPRRSANVSPHVGEVESDSEYFVIPSMFYSHRLDANRAVGFGLYAAGGMNTDYPVHPLNPASTVSTGIDLQQLIMSFAYAQRFGNISVGIAPTVGIQFFDSDNFSSFGTDDKPASAAGIALRGGLQWDLMPNFRLGVAGSTPGYVQSFTNYKTVFSNGKGRLQQPAFIQAGAAFDPMPNFTIMADYKRIFYEGSPAIGDDSRQEGVGNEPG